MSKTNQHFNKMEKFYRFAKNSDINIPLFVFKSLVYNLQRKRIFAYNNTVIKGLKNIQVNGKLNIGTIAYGFVDPKDRVLLNIKGSLVINGDVSIAKGCRFDIGEKATCILNDGCFLSPDTKLIVMKKLVIGKGTAISWNCELLDTDFHTIQYQGKKQKDDEIIIGDNVWLGSHVRLLKGAKIGHGSVVASGSLVTDDFSAKEKVLLAGSPAKIIKENVSWER